MGSRQGLSGQAAFVVIVIAAVRFGIGGGIGFGSGVGVGVGSGSGSVPPSGTVDVPPPEEEPPVGWFSTVCLYSLMRAFM